VIQKIVTIGVYGTNESAFFSAITNAEVDTFCDIRLHRGMRGSKFSYVNSSYLQKKLKELNINYLHIKELAPSKDVRMMQKKDDEARGAEKRTRSSLGLVFIEEYHKTCLSVFDTEAFLSSLSPASKVIALFCVERAPEACHRSLVGRLLKERHAIQLEDITP